MSVIASIAVHQCDLCRKVAVLKTDAEYELFGMSWHEGLRVDFCPDCRLKADAQEAIMQDNAARAWMLATVARVAPKADHCSPLADHSPEVPHAH